MSQWRLIDGVLTRGLCRDRDEARRLILAGAVRVNGHSMVRPSALVRRDADLTLCASVRPVSRAGRKLAFALAQWQVPVAHLAAADIGAATGGFTECLLRHGARCVYAIDTGKGQLDWSLRQDPRVVVMEDTNILYLEKLPEPVALATVDVSWTPLRQVLPVVERWLDPRGSVIALLKPNYELQDPGRLTAGVLTDDRTRQEVVLAFKAWAEQNGWRVQHAVQSPVPGEAGNIEYLTHLVRGSV